MSEISAARKRELRRRFNLGAPEPVASRPGALFTKAALPPCPRCRRPRAEWPLKRSAKCSPPDWVYCIRPVM